MKPRSEIESLAFLFRPTDPDDEQQDDREQQIGDAKRDIQKNDLPDKPEDSV